MSNDDTTALLDVTALGVENFTDPYPVYARLRADHPVVWMPKLDAWLVTRHADIRAVLNDSAAYVAGTPDSLIYDTFGEQMLTAEGDRHRHYRDAKMQAAFMPRPIGERIGDRIAARITALIDGFATRGEANLRHDLAARLPVQVMLDLFGLPIEDEPRIRGWYDVFERALANTLWDQALRDEAAAATAAFHDYLQHRIDARRAGGGVPSFLDTLIERPAERRLADDEIRRTALIIFFGGISTVEALTLNTLWALLTHPDALAAIRAEPAKLADAIDETMRWRSPVQSAVRHAVADSEVAGVAIPAGATIACMIGSGNRDAAAFDDADSFRLDRARPRDHLGFALGPHVCLGQHLARAEVGAAITALLARLPGLALTGDATPVGHEFHRPATFPVRWQ